MSDNFKTPSQRLKEEAVNCLKNICTVKNFITFLKKLKVGASE